MEIVNKFSETFNDLRMEHTVSRSDIATILDVSEATVGFWEREGRKPSFNQLIMLSRLFGVSVDYLIGNSDEQNNTNKKPDMVDKFKNSIHFKKYQENPEMFNETFQKLYNEFGDQRTRFITNKHAVLNTLKNNIEDDVYIQLEKEFSKLTGTIAEVFQYLMFIRAGSLVYDSDEDEMYEQKECEIEYLQSIYPTIKFDRISDEFIHNLYELKR